MKKVLLFFFAGTCLIACTESDEFVRCDNAVSATVRDLTGLDGCGFVFELENGTKLEPLIMFYCGTPPLAKEITEDPLFNFEWIDGKQVRIAFKEVTDRASICQVGPIVKITCLEEVSVSDEAL